MRIAPKEQCIPVEAGTGPDRIFATIFRAWVIRENMIPRFQTGNYEGAIRAGTEQRIARIGQNPNIPTR